MKGVDDGRQNNGMLLPMCARPIAFNQSAFPLGAESALEKAKKRDAYGKTYVSPWERAMKGNEDLLATMKTQMPGPYSYEELRKYKSFNRCSCIRIHGTICLSFLPMQLYFSVSFFACKCYLSICLGVLCPMEVLRRPLS